MALILDSEYLPAVLAAPVMSDQEFVEFCSDHPDLNFETSADNDLLVSDFGPTEDGIRKSELAFQLRQWAKKDGRGSVAESSAGFVLPNGARRAPDASWTLRTRIQQLPQSKRKPFYHLCPDFVVELNSPSDRLRTLKAKMQEYMENGAQLGWLIDPENRSVTIYRPNQSPETLTNIDSLTATEPLTGFTLDLAEVWNPLQ